MFTRRWRDRGACPRPRRRTVRRRTRTDRRPGPVPKPCACGILKCLARRFPARRVRGRRSPRTGTTPGRSPASSNRRKPPRRWLGTRDQPVGLFVVEYQPGVADSAAVFAFHRTRMKSPAAVWGRISVCAPRPRACPARNAANRSSGASSSVGDSCSIDWLSSQRARSIVRTNGSVGVGCRQGSLTF